ncbi:PITH domain-containing protein [Multifurca ochricompacta]|uniref:PITH domain-containing protein n=1 Tax=Multifurca ochricompacta TaxID=376703 RepID=A0AAD4M1W0_9AGAM|nr:PITH domain-containing protein [Multifurca ochricompacta]
MITLSSWHMKVLLLVLGLKWTSCFAKGVLVTIPLTAPRSAPTLSRSLVSFSLEQDRWVDWIGHGTRNPFFFNTLNNLKELTGEAPRIRVGANSEDHTNFDATVQFSESEFPVFTTTVPYPEATKNAIGNNYYHLASLLPPGTEVIFGVNFGQYNLTAAFLETTAIANAFASSTFKASGIKLEAIEIGNEADLYTNNGARNSSFNVQQYVSQWTMFAENVTATANHILGTKVPLQGAAFAGSSHTSTGFSLQGIFKNDILSSSAGSQIKLISQHHYSGSFCTGTIGILQNLMTKSSIRSNLAAFAPDITAVKQQGLTYVFGETNSYACHGSPGVSNTAGAALWGLDYALYASQLDITRLYFHHGIGYKYNFIQPATLTRSILDGSNLPQPLAPHIQPLYYAAIIAAEAIGSSGSTRAIELSVNNTQISGYAFFEGNTLMRAVFINLNAYTSGTRRSVHLTLNLAGSRKRPTFNIIKRLSIPTANATMGVTWGGQTYETQDGKVAGSPSTQMVPINTNGPSDNVFVHIDRDNVIALNSIGEGKEVIKPWNERLDEQEFIESDADDQLIIRIPFTGSVKLRCLLLKSGPGDQTPAQVALFTNADDLDFSDAVEKVPAQKFDVATGREVGEYALKPAKFPNVSSVTLFFPASQGAETTRIYYIGFLGQWSERKQEPVITVYESRANLADHEKIQGTEGNFSMPSQ